MTSLRKRSNGAAAVEEQAAVEPTPQVEQIEPQKETETKVEVATDVPQAVEPPSEPKEKTVEPDEPSATPVEDAAKNHLLLRLKEMEDADALNRQHIQRKRAEHEQREELRKRPAPSTEEIIANAPVPDHMKSWLRAHSNFVSDSRDNAALIRAHDLLEYRGIEPFSDGYVERLERMLGIKPRMNGHASVSPAAAPPRPQVHSAPPVSAPPTREAPSMSTGQRGPTQITLSPAEKEMAQMSGISLEEYARQKQKMLYLKSQGVIRDE